jgi:hypothetical protein
MEIDGFKIEGIANIPSLSMNVGKMSALIAPNGYGKSNVLRALEFAMTFLTASEVSRQRLMASQFTPLNEAMQHQDFSFELSGHWIETTDEWFFQYGFKFSWTKDDQEGGICAEWLRIKRSNDQRYRQLVNRTSCDVCSLTSSPSGRCTKPFPITSLQLALPLIATSADLYLNKIATSICSIRIPRLETLNNPESYFSLDENKGIDFLEGGTLSQYLYLLKTTDQDNYQILEDGILQLLPTVEEFSPEVVLMPDGRTRIYDIRIKEKNCVRSTSIRQLSSGSKRIILLFALCMAARKQHIPMIMLEEPENSVHPKLLENLLLALQGYAVNTKILFTSHSPYLMRHLTPQQMFLGLPKADGLVHFAQVNPSQLKYLYRYAGDMELTFGEFMFDFMLDVENDSSKLDKFFIQ